MISNKVPKISCVRFSEEAPTEEWVRSFAAQTYPNKELVVLSKDVYEGVKPEATLFINPPQNLPDPWAKDTLLELTTGDIICWWDEQDDPMWLAKRYRLFCGGNSDDKFFGKLEFHKAANMLYCGTDEFLNQEYWSKE